MFKHISTWDLKLELIKDCHTFPPKLLKKRTILNNILQINTVKKRASSYTVFIAMHILYEMLLL